MVGSNNLLSSCAHELAQQLKPRDFEQHWEGGYVYTEPTEFTPRCVEFAREIIKHVPLGKQGILVGQARTMGHGPIDVFNALARKYPSQVDDTRALTSTIAVACIIHCAWGIVCDGPYTQEDWKRVNE